MATEHNFDSKKIVRWFVKEEVRTPLAFFFKIIPYRTAAWVAILLLQALMRLSSLLSLNSVLGFSLVFRAAWQCLHFSDLEICYTAKLVTERRRKWSLTLRRKPIHSLNW